jgi:hypothetical protein
MKRKVFDCIMCFDQSETNCILRYGLDNFRRTDDKFQTFTCYTWSMSVNNVAGFITLAVIWLGAVSMGMAMFGGFGIFLGIVVGWIATIWLIKNLKQQ